MFNSSELLFVLPAEVVQNIDGVIVILKAAGIVAIAYILYVIGMGVLTFRKMKKIEMIDEKVDVLNKKLDKLLRKK